MDILDSKLKEYEEHFGENYVFSYGFTKSREEVIREIDNCIKTNVKQNHPVYADDLIY